jgi:ADP-heptose:LPS heptosyltransferase
MHLAASVGTPVTALYGSQKISTWRPVGEGHQFLQAPLPCRDCSSPSFCKPDDSYHNHCVRRITPDAVLAALRASLPDSVV